ncbi:ATP-binding protein [Sphingomonas faeni]|uniref:ATP-binding protein n=1 Tax=Sphingomonas faeni TaxID=185950 RepID=UPI002781E0DD|nr:ATP-binding protein [Sphingomonas faeni]MDQ0840296.1 recombinational DNA repair ATPase RecF [Sphingomonas faeni]
MGAAPQFNFGDAATFEQNIAAFSIELAKLDPAAAPVLSASLNALADEQQDKAALWNSLFAAEVASDAAPSDSEIPLPLIAPPVTAPVRWFLERLEIEGFRGINNEGSPLSLKFKPDCVASISAPNGVGKSSIFDALSFAIRGKIAKLDRLLQTEKPQDYYLNRFHPGTIGTVKITLKPDNGGQSVPILVTRDDKGKRTVSGPVGVDSQALLAELDREFVLLDAPSFQSFIDDKALDRGRAFSGLLGLSRYSGLRQQLQAISNTRAFNTHFDTSAHAAKLAAAQRTATTAKTAISNDYAELVKEPLVAGTPSPEAQDRCHAALHGIPVLVDHCAERPFISIDVDACLGAVRTAEDGPTRDRLGTIIREQTKWTEANKALPTEADMSLLNSLAVARTDALTNTTGDLLRKLYRLSEQVMTGDSWPSPNVCPTCENDDGNSVLENVRTKLGQYDAAETATIAVATEWASKGWAELTDLEALTLTEGEAPRIRQLSKAGETGTLESTEALELAQHVKLLRERATVAIDALAQERLSLERQLPQSLVIVTTAVETARRLQSNWNVLEEAQSEENIETDYASKVKRLKKFLDSTATMFADAESDMAAARLAKIEPLCQELFRYIMYSPVVPTLKKPKGSEDLSIGLAEFWGLKDLSAQALLSESYRNGFAVSVYLAAASLYGGAPRFIVLDDITSSFDAGHQHHLIEVIRTRFSRPVTADGPQVILLSHDTLLEKLFNKHSSTPEWSHQRIEGTAQTAILLQSGAVNKVRENTLELLQVGRVDDAAPRIRQYLEYTLHTVIDRCRIPVPLDIAFSDDRRTPGEYLGAIETAVKLYKAAGLLVLDPVQESALQMHSAMIISNFLSHWSTGQAQSFSAPALLGVMQAIDDFPDCFKYEPTPGAPKKFYTSLRS